MALDHAKVPGGDVPEQVAGSGDLDPFVAEFNLDTKRPAFSSFPWRKRVAHINQIEFRGESNATAPG